MFGKRTKLITLVLAIALILSQASAFAETGSYVLSIGGAGVETELNLSIKDLIAMPAESQIKTDYLYNSKTGEKTAKVKGVSLSYVLSEKASVNAENAEVIFETSDGYKVDPQSLQDIKNSKLEYVLAYEIDGEQKDYVTIYRKQKEVGEFNTVYKYVNKITVGKAIAAVEETSPIEAGEVVEKVAFTDITEEYKFAEEAINGLVAKGIVSGMGNGLYAPQDEFTRAQFCKMIVMGLNIEQMEYAGGFSDVAIDSWYAPYVQAAVESGLFKGNTDRTFQPDKTITRQEMASVASRAAVQLEKVSAEKLAKFAMEKSNYEDKADVAEWAANSVAWLESQKVFVDVAAEKFEPTKNVNRAEAAVVVFRTLFK